MPRSRPHVVLVVVDSLRARSLAGGAGQAATPFLDGLRGRAVAFRRAYATECWTLPTHLSMFTGLLPSQHGAHFQSMGYRGSAPTAAERAQAEGYETEVITRNSLFDGSVPGTTRGFGSTTRPLAQLPPRGRFFHLVLALAKPRVRRLLRRSGFFTVDQRSRQDFLETVARMGIPNDRAVLEHAVRRLHDAHRRGRRCFLFLNCYDVHAPYSPNERSPLQPWTSPVGLAENLRLAVVLPKISGHAYLKPGFALSATSRQMLRQRYETAIELMDGKLAGFWQTLAAERLLDDTVIIITSDHGEAFGEHGLYFHDASVQDVHLHVPLWIHHPGITPSVVDEVVSTRDLFALLNAVVRGHSLAGTLLDASHRQEQSVALAEHFHYPYVDDALPRFRHNQAAAIVGRYKLAVRGAESWLYDLHGDREERQGTRASLADFECLLREQQAPAAAVAAAAAHLRRWETGG